MTKKIIVEAVGIQNIRTGDDPGGDLEIYGHLGAWAIFTNSSGHEEHRIQHLLMDRQDPSQRQSITEGATLHMGKETPIMEIGDNERLWIGGHLKEQDDTSGNDSMGDRHNKIPEHLIEEETQRVRFSESLQVADAIFKIRFA
jgi:hypothetical protein